MVIDATQKFGEKFSKDQDGKSIQETNDRLREMGSPFTRMVGKAIDRINKHRTKEKAPD